jgi:hypothetical protein
VEGRRRNRQRIAAAHRGGMGWGGGVGHDGKYKGFPYIDKGAPP